MKPDSDVALVLERHAGEIARSAYKEFLVKNPGITQRFGADIEDIWTAHFCQKVLELSAAVLAGDTRLLRERMVWSAEAVNARKLHVDDLENSYSSLRYGITQVLPPTACEKAVNFLDTALSQVGQSEPAPMQKCLDPGVEHDRLALQYLQSVVVGNVHIGMDILIEQVESGMTVQDAFLKVLLPAQAEVGRLWHMNKLSVAEEHLVSTTTQRLMAVLASMAPRADDIGTTAVVASIAGNAHDMGVRTIAYLLEFEGWRTIVLGADVPAPDLPLTINCFQADLVLLSMGLNSQLPAMRHSIEQVRAGSHESVKIIVGGNGFAGATKVWQEIGADGFAETAKAAVRLSNELLGL